jgi:FkbM family methyltransferase
MKRVVARVVRTAVRRTIGPATAGRLIALGARAAGVDLLTLAYKKDGFLNYEDLAASGEEHFVTKLLAPRLVGQTPVIFDVGSNVGEYSELVIRAIPGARVFAFEPNPDTFEILRVNLEGTSIRCVPLGVGSHEGSQVLYVYPDARSAPHASVYRHVFNDFHQCSEPAEIACEFTALDRFCAREGVSKVHFLKIDAEGNELDVLRGARGLLSARAIDYLQFEFGEGSVYSRSFVRDFYQELQGYSFFRVHPDGLLPMGSYSPLHEVFRFQNIVAVPPWCPAFQVHEQ